MEKSTEKEEKIGVLTREKIAQILRENITFSGQVGDYVIHGAIDKLISEHHKVVNHLDDQFNALAECCGELANYGAGHKLGEINSWLDKYANESDWSINWRKILEERKLI